MSTYNGTVATSNADFQVYNTGNTNGNFFEQSVVANTEIRVQGANAVSGSNTTSLTPLAITITNPDDNNTTTNRPKVLLQSTDVGGSLLN